MESGRFQSQLLSVMEVLAQAAVEEINRRVDDSCAVLRLELSQSRRDIELLKSKCEVMEAELRRSRRRAQRTACNAPTDERVSSSFKVFSSQSSDRDGQVGGGSPEKLQQCAVMEPANEVENIPIKEEHAEEETWRNPQDKQISGAEQLPCFIATESAPSESVLESYHSASDPESPVSPAEGCNMFPEQQLSRNLNEGELVELKEEEEPVENAAPLASVQTVLTEEAEAQLLSTNLCRDDDDNDVSISYAGQQAEQFPSVFASQTGLHFEDMVPKSHCVKSNSALLSAARVKRRARTFGCKKLQMDEGLNAFNSLNSDLIPQQSQHQCRDETPHMGCDITMTNPSASICWQSRSSFSLARRMRTPWRSGLGEKRFSCSYCDKNFMRFSQLKEHLRSHTGEKPFSCAQCGRSFTKQCNLIRHAVVHSGEKPYECSLCGKCFTQRSSLKSHQKTTH